MATNGATSRRDADEKETGRVEAFSDGVFAIAITLLVLDIKVPRDLDGIGALTSALLSQWPIYLTYVLSFVTILIMWVNHHIMMGHIKRANQYFLMLNGLLLMGITVVPFPTSLLAEYLKDVGGAGKVAALVYGGTFTLIAVLFNVVWLYASTNNRLLARDADMAAVRGITARYRFGPLFYLVGGLLALTSAIASVAVYVLLALFFALPGMSGRNG